MFWKAFRWELVLNGIINLDTNFSISEQNSGWKDVFTFHRALGTYGLERGSNGFKESVLETGTEKFSNTDSSIKFTNKEVIH